MEVFRCYSLQKLICYQKTTFLLQANLFHLILVPFLYCQLFYIRLNLFYLLVLKIRQSHCMKNTCRIRIQVHQALELNQKNHLVLQYLRQLRRGSSRFRLMNTA
jgi:hypothetical protein